MKIALISYWSCPLAHPGVMTSGGMNVYIMQQALALEKLGNTIDIFTRSHKEHAQKTINISENIRIIHLDQSKKDLYEDVKIFADKIMELVQTSLVKYDILHTHYFYSGIVGTILKNELKIPFIHTFHTLAILKKNYGSIIDETRTNTEKSIGREADGLIVSTDQEKLDLARYYKLDTAKMRVIPPGVNHKLFHSYNQKLSRKKIGSIADKKIILFVGRIDPIKGITLLVESLAFLIQKYPEYENKVLIQLIGGDVKSKEFHRNKEVMKIKELIIKRNLECCVKFMGSQPHHLLPYFYSGADVVVMPSVYESFGLVVLEAMATGSVVVATSVGGLKYLIQDKVNGRLFESKNFKQLALILHELLENPNAREKLGNAAKRRSLDFCWDIQSKKMIHFYKKYAKN